MLSMGDAFVINFGNMQDGRLCLFFLAISFTFMESRAAYKGCIFSHMLNHVLKTNDVSSNITT